MLQRDWTKSSTFSKYSTLEYEHESGGPTVFIKLRYQQACTSNNDN